jgi:hypothetical protein
MSPELNTMKIGRGIGPVVGFPKLGVMTEKPARPLPIKGKQGRMAPFTKATRTATLREFPEQKLGTIAKETTEKEPAGYVRLRLLVRDGEVSVLSAKSVEGPLVEGKIQGALAYEVMLGQKRVAAGAIPDVGEKRSFPVPKGRGQQSGHFVTPLESYEINVRIPKERVSLEALPRLEVALYRLKEELPVEHPDELREIPLGMQFEKQVREVGRLKGFQPDKHAKSVAAQLRKAFK